MDKYSYSYDDKTPHGGSILIQEGAEQKQFIQVVFFGITQANPQQVAFLIALRELLPPHKKGNVPESEDGMESQLSILRVKTFLSALCWTLNDESIQREAVPTPYSFRVSSEASISPDKVWFELYRRVEGEHLNNFGRLIVLKDHAEMVKAALTKTCYILADSESRLRNALKTTMRRSGGGTEPQV